MAASDIPSMYLNTNPPKSTTYYNSNPYSHYSTIDDEQIQKDFTHRSLKFIEMSMIPRDTSDLVLDCNSLLQLPDHICDLKHLRKLSVANQLDIEKLSRYSKPALQKLPDLISNLSVLSVLNLQNNNLSVLPGAMCRMVNLQVLDLRMNAFETFPECICDMESLLTLKLCGNKLQTVSENISRLTCLQELTVMRNDITDLPESLCQLTSLHLLNLEQNKLSYLPSSLGNLPYLASTNGLLVGGNPLQRPLADVVKRGGSEILKYLRENPAVMRDEKGRKQGGHELLHRTNTAASVMFQGSDAPSMASKDVILNLSNKQYDDIDLSAHVLAETCPGVDLTKVTKLDVTGNDIETVRPDLNQLKSLETLILDDNCIVKSFPIDTIKGMTRLRKLGMSKQAGRQHMDSIYGHLTCLPTDMSFLRHLTHLHMSHNQIMVIPEEIKHMKNLVELDLMDNKYISVIPDIIGALTKLKYLGLSNNSIERVPPAIGKLKELRVLRLSLNRLQQLPDEICELQLLHTLSLSHNRLVYLPLHLDRLTRLVSDDVYNCDLLVKGKFQSCLKLDNNDNIKFPSSRCGSQKAVEVFADYKYQKQDGLECAQELINDAKKFIYRPPVNDRKWIYLHDKVFAFMSRYIGHEWRQLGHFLGLSREELDQCEANHRQLQHSIVEIFTRWRDYSSNSSKGEVTMVTDLQHAMSEIQNESLRQRFTEYIQLNCGWTTEPQ